MHHEQARRELRIAVLTLLLPLYIAVAFAANYIGALHKPTPHGVKVALVGPPATTAPLAHELVVTSKGGIEVSQLASVTEAKRLVGDRDLAGAYEPGVHPTVVVASAGSPSLATFVEGAFRKAAAAEDRPLAVDDVRPLPVNNPGGSPNFFFLIICTIGAFAVVVALGLVAPTLPEYQRLTIVAAACILAPVTAYLIGGVGYGTFSGDAGTIMAMLGLGVLYAFAVASTTRLLQLGLGKLGVLVASLTVIFLNFPSSGGLVAPQLLPGFWRFLNHFWIGSAALDANRSALYFGGAGAGTDVLKILGWVAAFALTMLPLYVLRARRSRASAVAGKAQREPGAAARLRVIPHRAAV